MFDERQLSSMAEGSGSLWRSHVILGRCYAEELLPLLAPAPVSAEDVRDGPTEFVPPRMSIHYQGVYGPIKEMISPAPKGERFVEQSIPHHQTSFSREVVSAMVRCIDAFRSQLVQRVSPSLLTPVRNLRGGEIRRDLA